MREIVYFRKYGRLAYPRILQLEITNMCPLHCPQCYKDGFTQLHMDFTLAKMLVDEFTELGGKRTMLNGGEPLIYPHFTDLVTYISDKGVVPTTFTSGVGLDVSMINRLKETKVELLISLNDSTEEINSTSRDGYNESLRAIKFLQKCGMTYGVNYVARHDNAHDFRHLVDFLKGYGCSEITVVCNKVNGTGNVESALTRDDYDMIKAVSLDHSDFISMQNCNNIMAQYFYNMPISRLYGCPAGISSMCATVDGSFVPCPHLYFKESRIYESIQDYWDNSFYLNELRRWDTQDKTHCSNCSNKEKCNFCRAISKECMENFSIGYQNCPLFEEESI